MYCMQLTLTVTESPNLPKDVLVAFAQKAKGMGKTADQYLAELISKNAASPTPTKKGARK